MKIKEVKGEKNREYRIKNRLKVKRYSKQYKSKNLHKFREYQRKYRLRQKLKI
ncbi:MAG TPA: hypothetical protein VJB94_04575 [Candidatus Nanoarchaeia archaeon]|nr:hypothetical protein [Candidatus Nanoarchaeia archaeon]